MEDAMLNRISGTVALAIFGGGALLVIYTAGLIQLPWELLPSDTQVLLAISFVALLLFVIGVLAALWLLSDAMEYLSVISREEFLEEIARK